MQTSAVTDSHDPALTPVELAAWRGMLRAHAELVSVPRRRAARRRTSSRSHEYEVLLILDNAPERRLRMSDLAAAVVLSQSGLTRLVDRLVLAGSVERTRCETDRRGLNAELTAAGRHGSRRPGRRTSPASGRGSSTASTRASSRVLAGFWERVLPGATSD